MKKTFQAMALVLIVVIASLTLCSCNSLDKKRAGQAFYGITAVGDTDTSTILFDSITFKEFASGELADGRRFIFDGIDSFDDSHYVTEQDVPVLLRKMFGLPFEVNPEKTLLYVGGDYYCREDMLATYLEALKTDLTAYCTVKHSYLNANSGSQYIKTSAEETAALRRIMGRTPVESDMANLLESAGYRWKSVYICDENTLMCADTDWQIIMTEQGAVYLCHNATDIERNPTFIKVSDDEVAAFPELFGFDEDSYYE